MLTCDFKSPTLKKVTRNHFPEIRARSAQLGFSQERVALEIGIDPTLFSRILNGLRRQPEGFEVRVMEALDRLERAEKAAQEARERVLSGESAA